VPPTTGARDKITVSDFLDFIDAPSADDTTPAAATPAEAPPPAPEAVVTPPEPTPDPDAGQPRDENGRFAPKAGDPEPPAQPPAPDKPAAPPQEVAGVMKALLDERDRRQAIERELEALRKAQPQQPQGPPDRHEDPEGYDAYQQRQIDDRFQTVEASRVNDRLNFSERLARKEYGQDTVAAAKAWGLERGAQDPAFAQKVLTDPDPYELIVTEHKRHQALQTLNDPTKLEQFNAWLAAQNAGAAPPAPVQAATPPPAAPAPPPRSIIHAPAAGGGKPGEVQAGPGVAFNSIFPS
jgi:hypothetical protein